MMHCELRIPRPDLDLVADLIVVPDPCLGDPEGLSCRATPAQLRLFVAAMMLWSYEDSREARLAALREAYELYDGSGTGLLDQPRKLTTSDIVAEVMQLTQEET